MQITKIQVVCPSGAVTGGPESLHNLVALLRTIGEVAEIVYHPFPEVSHTPEKYRDYGAKSSPISDERGTLVILPEILCFEAKRFSESVVAIWWLSVDNFREKKYHNWRDPFRYIKKCFVGQRPWRGVRALRQYLHFSKSYYDLTYLMEQQIFPFQLTGPVSTAYINEILGSDTSVCRKNEILYNPKKGRETIHRLMAACPEWLFVPLVGHDQGALISKYRESKLYIDFGHHPGRERMPREATACGCCVITGVLGSAGNAVDIPIPRKFKVNERSADFIEQFRAIVSYVFGNFSAATKEFDAYRLEIRSEPQQQKEDIKNILQALRFDSRSGGF